MYVHVRSLAGARPIQFFEWSARFAHPCLCMLSICLVERLPALSHCMCYVMGGIPVCYAMGVCCHGIPVCYVMGVCCRHVMVFQCVMLWVCVVIVFQCVMLWVCVVMVFQCVMLWVCVVFSVGIGVHRHCFKSHQEAEQSKL